MNFFGFYYSKIVYILIFDGSGVFWILILKVVNFSKLTNLPSDNSRIVKMAFCDVFKSLKLISRKIWVAFHYIHFSDLKNCVNLPKIKQCNLHNCWNGHFWDFNSQKLISRNKWVCLIFCSPQKLRNVTKNPKFLTSIIV